MKLRIIGSEVQSKQNKNKTNAKITIVSSFVDDCRYERIGGFGSQDSKPFESIHKTKSSTKLNTRKITKQKQLKAELSKSDYYMHIPTFFERPPPRRLGPLNFKVVLGLNI